MLLHCSSFSDADDRLEGADRHDNATCTTTMGSYHCVCDQGFTATASLCEGNDLPPCVCVWGGGGGGTTRWLLTNLVWFVG